MQGTLGTLGVLVNEREGSPPFADEVFCQRLCEESNKFDMNVVVITPKGSAPNGKYQGYRYVNENWTQETIDLPDLIYDRCLTPVPGVFRRRLRQASKSASRKIRFLSRALPGKWHVYQTLQSCEILHKHLPETELYTSKEQLKAWLKKYPDGVFLKPQAGSHGKSTVRAQWISAEHTLCIQGRNRYNRSFEKRFSHLSSGLAQLHRILIAKPYIIQPFLPLMNKDTKPFDLRALVQKNGAGQWDLSGLVIREGPAGSLTSNLHGGGTARDARTFLEQEYGKEATPLLFAKTTALSALIPSILESRYGRLSELGIDYGIDRNGQLWILEVNSKPGRAAFLLSGDSESINKACHRPLEYARYLLLRSHDSPIH
ncbi:YheC/YheD family protein [Paenibacillus polygoni]|uniref:YheC/YheD family protein n=1 Tax=Paenibacillus polygoni TaxID=3050112 RepID=A0ABY8X674_9BACL|nr:YheC/YheD family protein [Paenibacillus polygoni]WIV20538.1 YheC/YheD family protein [Paenibacillus polygoni]